MFSTFVKIKYHFNGPIWFRSKTLQCKKIKFCLAKIFIFSQTTSTLDLINVVPVHLTKMCCSPREFTSVKSSPAERQQLRAG